MPSPTVTGSLCTVRGAARDAQDLAAGVSTAPPHGASPRAPRTAAARQRRKIRNRRHGGLAGTTSPVRARSLLLAVSVLRADLG